MKLNSKIMSVIIVIVMFGGILLSSAFNLFQTVGTKVPVTYKEGEAAGQYNPADIRGSYVWADIINYFGIPEADLRAAFDLTPDIKLTDGKVNSLEAKYAGAAYEIGTGSVRVFVALYKGLPYTWPETDTYLTKAAAAVLKKNGKLTAETTAYLDKITVDVQPATGTPAAATAATAAPGVAPTVVKTEGVSSTAAATDKAIKGKTTFKDLTDWGVKNDVIQKIIGGEVPASGTVIKDYCTSKSLDFETIRAALQVEVDKVK